MELGGDIQGWCHLHEPHFFRLLCIVTFQNPARLGTLKECVLFECPYFWFSFVFIPISILIIADTVNLLQNAHKDILYVYKLYAIEQMMVCKVTTPE